MKKIIILLTLSLFLESCATTSQSSHTGGGFIYSNHFEGEIITSNHTGRRRGKACTENVLGLFTSGDASVSAAMKDGGITIVSSADREYKSVLGIWGKMCLIVTGN